MNIDKMIEKNLSEKQQDLIVANILKRKIKTENANIPVKIRNIELELSTEGK